MHCAGLAGELEHGEMVPSSTLRLHRQRVMSENPDGQTGPLLSCSQVYTSATVIDIRLVPIRAGGVW